MWYYYIGAFIAGALITNIILDHSSSKSWDDLPFSQNVEDRR